MARYKIGAKLGLRAPSLRDLEVYASGPLPRPPASVTVPKAPYEIDGNDRFGDCVAAGMDHLIEAWNVLYKQHDFNPTGQEVIKRYFELTGGEDSGLNEQSVLDVWYRQGQFHEKIVGFAPVNPRNLVTIHQGIAFYGGLMLGIECPESAQEQFSEGKPWTYIPGSPIEGGHCIIALGYDTNGDVQCATWGGVVTVRAGFWAHYVTEAWCILPHQAVEAGKDLLGVGLAELKADLARI